MSKPQIKKITDDTMLDGTVVWENDARINAEIQGNIEQSDITQTHHVYDIGPIGPIWYTKKDGDTVAGVRPILLFLAPRTFYLRAIQACALTHFENSNVTQDISGTKKLLVRADKKTYSPADDEGTDPWGPYNAQSLDGWTSLASFNLTAESELVYAKVGEATHAGFGLVKKGEWFRVSLSALDPAEHPKAAVSVMLTVAEEHLD